jgi:hypothetical protein
MLTHRVAEPTFGCTKRIRRNTHRPGGSSNPKAAMTTTADLGTKPSGMPSTRAQIVENLRTVRQIFEKCWRMVEFYVLLVIPSKPNQI